MNDERKMPEVGELLYGPDVVLVKGVTAWTDFPRYEVLAHHPNGLEIFVSILKVKRQHIGYEVLNITSSQWKTRQELAKFEEELLVRQLQVLDEQQVVDLAKKIHYPECWDTMAYPTLYLALESIVDCSECTQCHQG